MIYVVDVMKEYGIYTTQGVVCLSGNEFEVFVLTNALFLTSHVMFGRLRRQDLAAVHQKQSVLDQIYS